MAEAQFNLGFMYYKGEGIKLDYSKAAHWFESYSQLGYQDVQNELAKIYILSDGVYGDRVGGLAGLKRICDTGIQKYCDMYTEWSQKTD